jgi:hypothetical protein
MNFGAIKSAMQKAFGKKKDKPDTGWGDTTGVDEVYTQSKEEAHPIKKKMRQVPRSFIGAPMRIANKWAGTKFKVPSE